MSVRLRSVVDLITSCNDKEVREYVALENLEGGTGQLLPDIELRECLAPASGAAAVERGDVLFGKLRPYLAKTWLVDRAAFASSELLCLRPRPGVYSRWLGYVCISRPLLEWAVATSDGTKMPRTSWDKLAEYRLDVPAAGRQRAIADFLDAETARVDALITKKRKLVDLTDSRLRAHAGNLTTAEITVGLNKGGTTVKQGWRPMRLRRCLATIDYGIGEASNAVGAVAVLSMGNIDDHGRIGGEPGGYVDSVDGWLLLRPGDLLFNRTNSLAKVGKLGLLREVDEPTTFASYLVRFRTTLLADATYLNYALNTDEVLGLARSTALPSIGQANLNPARYSELRIALPSLGEQHRIVAELDAERCRVEALSVCLQRQILLLQERRQALITAAVIGQLDIPGVSAA